MRKHDKNSDSKSNETPKKKTKSHNNNSSTSNRSNSSRKKKYTPKKGNNNRFYASHLSYAEANKLYLDGLVYKGTLRVNKNNRNVAYISVPEFHVDICIQDDMYRNRALPGDEVFIELLPKKEWKFNAMKFKAVTSTSTTNTSSNSTKDKSLSDEFDLSSIRVSSDPSNKSKLSTSEVVEGLEVREGGDEANTLWRPRILMPSIHGEDRGCIDDEIREGSETATTSTSDITTKATPFQPTAKVVHIIERKGSMDFLGVLDITKDITVGAPLPSSKSYVLFKPMDSRCCYIRIPFGSLPPDFTKDPHKYFNTLYSARITSWPETNRFPEGLIRHSLGEAGEIAVETAALLSEFDLTDADFSPEVLECLEPFMHGWGIDDDEIDKRIDLRGKRIFSIDPTTARDLDDALHISKIDDETYEIGVHIADVTHFIAPGGALDLEAQRRATTVYLVQMIIPMLPRLLCENLCSLNPGVDRLAFSVVFRMKIDGTLTSDEPKFFKSVIHSCAKLDYGTAQKMIDGEIVQGQASYSSELWESERQPIGDHTCDDVIQDVLNLHKIAMERRRKRYEGGALSLSKGKTAFRLDEDGNPFECFAYPIKESNQLIEEFMLLANYLVAQRLLEKVKSKAFLRCHPPPDPQGLEKLLELAAVEEVDIKASNAGELQRSFERLSLLHPDDPSIRQLWENMAVICMQQAQYFAAGDLSPHEWQHYALAIPYYTHFTSPIRRYADVMVHRLLHEIILKGDDASKSYYLNLGDLNKIAKNCNEKNSNSRFAQERSDFIFTCVYLNANPTETLAVVTEVSYGRFKLVIPQFATEVLVLLKDIGCDPEEAKRHWDGSTLKLPASVQEMVSKDSSTARSLIGIRFKSQIRIILTAKTTMPLGLTVKILEIMS